MYSTELTLAGGWTQRSLPALWCCDFEFQCINTFSLSSWVLLELHSEHQVHLVLWVTRTDVPYLQWGGQKPNTYQIAPWLRLTKLGVITGSGGSEYEFQGTTIRCWVLELTFLPCNCRLVKLCSWGLLSSASFWMTCAGSWNMCWPQAPLGECPS